MNLRKFWDATPINQSIDQDISNAPANKKSRWRAWQNMDEIKKIKKIMNV